jgi:hypothetical protein
MPITDLPGRTFHVQVGVVEYEGFDDPEPDG